MDDRNYWQRLSGSRLARRSLLRSAGVAVAGIGAAALAGCGRGGSSSSGAAKPSGGAATGAGAGGGQPVRGGVFSGRINTDPPTTWIPSGAITYGSVWPFAPAYNQLLQWDPQDPDNKIIPDLADSHEIAGDARSIVFKLHSGVKFHDGADLTSEDVRATIDWTRNPPPKKNSSQQGVLEVIDHVEIPDPLTVKLVLKRPNPSLLGTLASHFGCIGAKTDLTRDDLGTIVNGTGPFKLKSLTRGVGVELERNPSHWVKDRPYMDGVKYAVVFDENTAMTDLIAGRFHRYFPLVPDNAGRAERETGGRVKEYVLLSPNRDTLFFNTSKKPFNDPRVRQAVSLAIDRNEAINVSAVGKGALGGYMMPGGPWASPIDQVKKVPGYDKADIAEAKKLLAAAGVTEPLSGVLLTRSEIPQFVATATYVQGILQKTLGWNYKIDARDSAAAFAAAYGGQFDLCTWIYGLTFDDPDATFGQLTTSNATFNLSKVYDSDADALFLKQSQTLDVAQRRQLVQQLELKYLNDFISLTLFFRKSIHAISTVVQNYKLSPYIYTNQRYQDVWLSKA